MHVSALPGQIVDADTQLRHVPHIGDFRAFIPFNDSICCGTITTEGLSRCQPQIQQHDTRDYASGLADITSSGIQASRHHSKELEWDDDRLFSSSVAKHPLLVGMSRFLLIQYMYSAIYYRLC
jgi:hypothetical protein